MLPMLVLCGAVQFLFHPAVQQSADSQSTESHVEPHDIDLVPVLLNEPPSSRSKSPKSHVGPDGVPGNDASAIELMAILDKWEAASRKTEPTVLKIQRTDYDLEQKVESHSSGEFVYESPKPMGVILRPSDPLGSAGRMDTEGNLFRVENGPTRSRILLDHFLLNTDDNAKTYEQIELPPQPGQANFFEPWIGLPFFFDIHVSRIRKDWSLRLEKSKGQLRVIRATPESGPWKGVVNHCLVMIDLTNGKTSAIKLVLESEKREIVYSASNLRIVGMNVQNRLEKNWTKGYVRAPFRGWTSFLPAFEP